jgi:hypothetical protein
MRVGYEALSWARHSDDYRDPWAIARRANHPVVRAVFGTVHIQSRVLTCR